MCIYNNIYNIIFLGMIATFEHWTRDSRRLDGGIEYGRNAYSPPIQWDMNQGSGKKRQKCPRCTHWCCRLQSHPTGSSTWWPIGQGEIWGGHGNCHHCLQSHHTGSAIEKHKHTHACMTTQEGLGYREESGEGRQKGTEGGSSTHTLTGLGYVQRRICHSLAVPGVKFAVQTSLPLTHSHSHSLSLPPSPPPPHTQRGMLREGRMNVKPVSVSASVRQRGEREP